MEFSENEFFVPYVPYGIESYSLQYPEEDDDKCMPSIDTLFEEVFDMERVREFDGLHHFTETKQSDATGSKRQKRRTIKDIKYKKHTI